MLPIPPHPHICKAALNFYTAEQTEAEHTCLIRIAVTNSLDILSQIQKIVKRKTTISLIVLFVVVSFKIFVAKAYDFFGVLLHFYALDFFI